MPVALRAAADTNSGAGVAFVSTKAAVSLPPAAPNTPVSSATLPSLIRDPHPLITEFYGPAPQSNQSKTNTASPKLPQNVPQAQLQPGAPAN